VSGTYSPTSRRGTRVVAGGEWVRCKATLCLHEKPVCALLALGQSRSLHLQKLLLVVD